MSDERKYTPVEVREIQRMAFVDGARYRQEYGKFPVGHDLHNEAKRRYPIQRKVPRPFHVGPLTLFVDGPGAIRVKEFGTFAWGSTVNSAALRDWLDDPYETVNE